MSLQNPFQSLSQVCWVGQNDFRSKLRRSVVLLLLSIFNYPFRINIQQESSFHEFLTHLKKLKTQSNSQWKKKKKDAFRFWNFWLSIRQVATYSQQYIVSQPIQIDTSTLDQNTLYSINSQSLTL